MTEEIAKIEADLNNKHEEELSQFKSSTDTKVQANMNTHLFYWYLIVHSHMKYRY